VPVASPEPSAPDSSGAGAIVEPQTGPGGASLGGGGSGAPAGVSSGVRGPFEPDARGGGGIIEAVLGAVTQQVQSTVKPAVVAALAQTFTFPLALAAIVLLFLLIQSRLDGRDPKLRYAPRSAGEVYIEFGEEDR
jgi:hypothetical protein